MKMKKILASLLMLAMIATLVPFAAFAEGEVQNPDFVFDSAHGSMNSNAVPVTFVGGIGGKASDDTAMVFNYQKDTALTTNTRWQFDTTGLNSVGTSGGKSGIWFAFNLYADGDAIAKVGRSSGHDIIRWYPDGRMVFPQYGSNTADKVVTVERGKWHRIGLSLNESNGGSFNVFVDGVDVGGRACKSHGDINSKSPMYFGIEEASGKGMVAYDDPACAYWANGTVKYSKTVLANDKTTSNDDYFRFSENVININNFADYEKYSADVNLFKSDIAKSFSNVNEVRLLTEDMTVEATSVDETKNVLVKTTNDAYYYYFLADYVMTVFEKIGLEKAENTSSPSDNWLSNIVFIDNQKLGVYSSLNRNLSTVSSKRLVELGLVSTEGYALSYVDENKNPATAESVQGGYVKASKDGEEDIYIEIVKKANYQGPYDVTAGVLDQRNSTLVNASGVAGKSADDVSYGFKNASASWLHPKYAFSLMDEITQNPDGTRTYVFNVYADGDAVAQFAMSGLNASNTENSYYYFMKWDASTGDFYAPDANNSVADAPTHYLEPGQWHQIALTYDRGSNGGLEIYLDGNLISSEFTWNKYNGIGLGILNTEPTGRVLYDDVEIYNGFYDPNGSIVAPKTSKDDFVLDTVNDVIYYDNMDVAALKAAVMANTDASAVEVYTDSTITTVATELTEDSVVFATAANGFRYEYFTLKSIDEIPAPEFVFEPSTHVVTAKTKFLQGKNDMVLYVATYTADNTLVNVDSVPVAASDINKEISLKIAYGTSAVKTVKAFLWYEEELPMAVGEINVDLSTPEEAE